MKRIILLPILLMLIGCNNLRDKNKQKLAIYCNAKYSTCENCHSSKYMSGDLQSVNVISCDSLLIYHGALEDHIHYCIIYTGDLYY